MKIYQPKISSDDRAVIVSILIDYLAKPVVINSTYLEVHTAIMGVVANKMTETCLAVAYEALMAERARNNFFGSAPGLVEIADCLYSTLPIEDRQYFGVTNV